MHKPVEVRIGLRYTRSRRHHRFISFLSSTSMLGIALGVAALITVLSVMNGFEGVLRQRILGMASHATISGPKGVLDGWRGVAEAARRHPRVVGVAPFVEGQAMLARGSNVQGATVRGVLPREEPAVSEVGSHMVAGKLSYLNLGPRGIILGRDLARALGVGVGDRVTVVAPKADVIARGELPGLRRFTVAGLFEVGQAEYDTALAIVNLGEAQQLFGLKDRVSGVRVKVDDLYAAPRVRRDLARDLGGRFVVRDWTEIHAGFFRALGIEKTVMTVILTLIVGVAAFNLVSALTMVVTSKQGDIAILRTLGLSPGGILMIFLVQGAVIGLAGTALGVVGGIVLADNVQGIISSLEGLLNTRFLSPDVYYITEVPSDLQWSDVVPIAIIAFILSALATVYPAWRASRIQPAAALRQSR